ncbi:MAG: pyruvate carboxyltransferase [Nitrososphaerota archaeon]|nr:pyruvate carboxyltransferase [Nitrososphaerota archaeon]
MQQSYAAQDYRTDNYFVSFYNYLEEVRGQFHDLAPRVKFHDITLRDGEQQANVIFRKEEKIKIAQKLDEAGIDRIEAGMPSVSRQDQEAITKMTHLGLSSKIYAFARCIRSDVDMAIKCDVDGIMMEVPSSDHLIKYGYGWSEERALSASIEATDYAHKHGLPVTFFTIDSTRASFDIFWRLVNAVATEGYMDALTLVDTFGVASPHAISYFVKRVKEKLGTKRPLEIHVHNDFGLAVANTIAAVMEGVDTLHTTVNGIGERSGNASTEEVAMALKLLYGVNSNVRYEKLRSLSKLVQELSLIKMPPQKPITGDNLFTTESGIIAGWWSRLEELNMPLEMFPFLPSFAGHDSKINVVLGKKSGRDSIVYKGKKMGIRIPEDKIDKILVRVKETSEDKKRILTDDEFLAIVRETVPAV